MEIEAPFPDKLRFLFEPCRYKVAYGGRGSGKSWSYARALLILGAQSKIRVLCAREVQKSIKQSVHTLLSDQIQALGLGSFYEVTHEAIKGANGTDFSFCGLAYHTVESIKSFEGVDICWVEEAQTVSKRSWDILIPTIRKPDSEIWISFNPDLDSDETYQRFVANPPAESIVRKVNYSDNPWFPDVLEAERLDCLAQRPEDYDNIWEGKCKAAVEGAIYAKEVAEAIEAGRVCNVPYDPMLKVHVVFDLGWNDSMFLSLVQRGPSDIRVIESIEDDHKTLDYFSGLLKAKSLNWGQLWLPHDGDTKDFKTGKSSRQILKAMGWDVRIIPRHSIEAGIRLARQTFPRVYWDKKASRQVDCLKRYRRNINQATGEPGTPLHDEYSHGADNFRYICAAVDQMKNEEYEEPEHEHIGYANGWMA